MSHIIEFTSVDYTSFYPNPHRHLHRRAVGVRKGGAEDVGRMLPGDVARVASSRAIHQVQDIEIDH